MDCIAQEHIFFLWNYVGFFAVLFFFFVEIFTILKKCKNRIASSELVYFSSCGCEQQHFAVSTQKTRMIGRLGSPPMFISAKLDLTNRLFIFFTISTEAVKLCVAPIYSTLSKYNIITHFFFLESY